MKKTFTNYSLSSKVGFALFACMMASTLATSLDAQCTAVGTGTVTGNVSFGSSNNWANPNRCTVSDDLHSRVQLMPGETSKYLLVADFGYVIPAAATITGVEVSIEGHQEDLIADFADASIMLTLGGVPIGTDHAGTGYYDDKDYVNVYGNSTDLWGLSLTPGDVMDPSFGILYSVTRNSGPGTLFMFVDYVFVTVYYTGDGCILPVTYKAYDVSLQEDHTVKLDWITATEVGSSYYSIERSTDGTTFDPIGTVQAAGGDHDQQYSFTDATPMDGISYYRLQQVDNNGASSYTEVRMITNSKAGTLAVAAFPNPTTDFLQLRGDLAGSTAQLYDVGGRLVMQTTLADNAQTLDVTQMGEGVYLLKVASTKGTHTQRILIQ